MNSLRQSLRPNRCPIKDLAYPRLRCPVCRQPLWQEDRTWGCANGHRFDEAREGYLHLHLAHHKGSKQPGDSKEMVNARRAFLAGGHYDPLIQAIAAVVQEQQEGACVLDTGCGEGAYLRRLVPMMDRSFERIGLDISKSAVRLAAKADKDGLYLVASSFDLPVLDEAVDAVIRVFAPGDADEVRRVLKPGGYFLIATPGPRHLFELKQRIYEQPREHAESQADIEGFERFPDVRVGFELKLTSGEAIANLLAMTPFYWRASEDVQQELQGLAALDVTVDFKLSILRKK